MIRRSVEKLRRRGRRKGPKEEHKGSNKTRVQQYLGLNPGGRSGDTTAVAKRGEEYDPERA